MPRHAQSLPVAALGIGVLLFMTALYGQFGTTSGLISIIGGIMVLAGTGALVLARKPFALSRPHAGTLAVAAAAVALHAFECFAETRSGAALGFFFWGMTPYGLCLLISSLSTVRVAPVAGAV